MRLSFFVIDSLYITYLRSFDHRVNLMEKSPLSRRRPLVGVLLEIESIKFYAPLSSPKVKHLTMKEGQDFIKIDAGRLGVINLNNMIPVKDLWIIILDPSQLLTITKEDLEYKNLLDNQLTWCNSHKELLQRKARKLYDLILSGKARTSLVQRCCDFKLLCEKCTQYK